MRPYWDVPDQPIPQEVIRKRDEKEENDNSLGRYRAIIKLNSGKIIKSDNFFDDYLKACDDARELEKTHPDWDESWVADYNEENPEED